MDSFRVGVDTGGTFTDFTVLNETTGETIVFKTPSTPKDPSEAILRGLEILLGRGISAGSIRFFSHGTTVATNALLEKKGARTGVLITKGFTGIDELADQTRGYGPATYDLFFEKPDLLVPPNLKKEITERIDFEGNVLEPLDTEAVIRGAEALQAAKVEALAIFFLFSFTNSQHEVMAKKIVEDMELGCFVTTSSEVIPQIREYQRFSTTIINAYTAPKLQKYLERMDRLLRETGLNTKQFYVMQSNGGVATAKASVSRAVNTVLSGPAGGVIAGAKIAAMAGFKNVITMDMGGTSCDVAVVPEGEPIITTQGKIDNRDIATPMIDINTISAGGGTIARVDRVGVLQVGPDSAGADPGPVCYGKGGDLPTVTDANIVLGFLDSSTRLGDSIELDRNSSLRAIEDKIASPLGIETLQAADGITQIVNVKMKEAIKQVTLEKGFDPREFVLVAFGGAGPIHAGRLASELNIPRVLIPPSPGVTSATGLLIADVKREYVQSKLTVYNEAGIDEVKSIFAELCNHAGIEFQEDCFSEDEVTYQLFLDLRYSGQGYEVRVPVKEDEINSSKLNEIRTRFDSLHEQLYGHKAEKAVVEIVNCRVVAVVETPKIKFYVSEEKQGQVNLAQKGTRKVFFTEIGQPTECPVYDRKLLPISQLIIGPAIVEQADSTTVIYPGQRAVTDRYGNLIISHSNEL